MPSVLLFEESGFERAARSALLARRGCDVAEYDDLRAATEAISQETFDFVVATLRADGSDEVIQHALKETPQPRVVARDNQSAEVPNGVSLVPLDLLVEEHLSMLYETLGVNIDLAGA